MVFASCLHCLASLRQRARVSSTGLPADQKDTIDGDLHLKAFMARHGFQMGPPDALAMSLTSPNASKVTMTSSTSRQETETQLTKQPNVLGSNTQSVSSGKVETTRMPSADKPPSQEEHAPKSPLQERIDATYTAHGSDVQKRLLTVTADNNKKSFSKVSTIDIWLRGTTFSGPF